MNVETACGELVSRLEQLSVGAKKAKHRILLNCVDQFERGDNDRFVESFKAMAIGMTGALGDIVDRLDRLDKILHALDGGQTSDIPAAMAPLPRRSPARSAVRKSRSRRNSHLRTIGLRR